MALRPEDLTDTPLSDRRAPTPAAKIWLARAHFALDDEKYRFGWDTIERMRAWVEETGRVTEKMESALENIIAGGDRQHTAERGWKRRYEGR